MTWPIFAGLGDWVIPVAWTLALVTGMVLGLINGLIVWNDGGGRLHRDARIDARLSRVGVHVQRRKPHIAPELDAGRYGRSRHSRHPNPDYHFRGLYYPDLVVDDPYGAWPQRPMRWGDNREAAVNAGIRGWPAYGLELRIDWLFGSTFIRRVLLLQRVGKPQ